MIRRILFLLYRRLLLPLLLAGTGAAGVYLAWWVLPLLRLPEPAPPLTLQRLSEVAELLTLRIEVREVVTCRIDGYTGGIEAALIVEGDVALAVDLGQAKLLEVDKARQRATLVLPPPVPLAPRLDHEGTRFVAISRDGLWLMAPTHRPEASVVHQALAQAQQRVAAAGTSSEAAARARRHAEQVLASFCHSLGWTIDVTWEHEQAAP